MPTDDSLARFRRVVADALSELENRRQEVNDLNVFPVADGDTGDNMALTMRAVLEALNEDRKSTRLNSSHANISYAVFCLKKKTTNLAHQITHLCIPMFANPVT